MCFLRLFGRQNTELLEPILADADNNEVMEAIRDHYDDKSKLLMCIGILKGHEKRKQLPQLRSVFHLINFLSLTAATTHLGISIAKYQAAFKHFSHVFFSIEAAPGLIDTWDCEEYFRLETFLSDTVYQLEFEEFCDSVWGAADFAQTCLVSALQKVQEQLANWDRETHVTQVCANVISNMLNGSLGMWNGYIPVIAIFGIAAPLILSAVDLKTNFVNRGLERCSDSSEYLDGNKATTIKFYAARFGIILDPRFPHCDDYAEILSDFEEKLGEVMVALDAVVVEKKDEKEQIEEKSLQSLVLTDAEAVREMDDRLVSSLSMQRMISNGR